MRTKLLVLLLLSFATTIHAAEISGIVREGLDPIQGATVEIYEPGGNVYDSDSTDAGGFYLISGLPEGTYYVKAYHTSLSYVPEVFNNVSCINSQPCPPAQFGTPVEITELVPGVADFNLEAGGSISGKVTSGG